MDRRQVVARLLQALAILTHPAVVEAALLSYYSKGHAGWIIASWGLLPGMGGLLYLRLRAYRLDLAGVLGSPRRVLLLWNLLVIGGLWAATADPLLHFWLNFLLWISFCGFLLHWWREYSFHVYAWAALTGLFLGYSRSYPFTFVLLLSATLSIGYLRWKQQAHPIPELVRGGIAGGGLGLLFFAWNELAYLR